MKAIINSKLLIEDIKMVSLNSVSLQIEVCDSKLESVKTKLKDNNIEFTLIGTILSVGAVSISIFE